MKWKFLKKWIGIILALLTLFSAYFPPLFAATETQELIIFEQLFRDWTDAFNRQDLKTSCALFSESVIADYQGHPQKNYADICDGFKKVFNEKNKKYHYDFKIQNSYLSQDLAAIRITWYLTIYEDGKKVSSTQDEGLDILQHGDNGWKIINYIGFPVKD